MKFKIMNLEREDLPHGDTPVSDDQFSEYIVDIADGYAEQGWEIKSLSFLDKDSARLFLYRPVRRVQ